MTVQEQAQTKIFQPNTRFLKEMNPKLTGGATIYTQRVVAVLVVDAATQRCYNVGLHNVIGRQKREGVVRIVQAPRIRTAGTT